jgi:hypothetical protein
MSFNPSSNVLQFVGFPVDSRYSPGLNAGTMTLSLSRSMWFYMWFYPGRGSDLVPAFTLARVGRLINEIGANGRIVPVMCKK